MDNLLTMQFSIGWTARGVTVIEADDIFEASALAAESIKLDDTTDVRFVVSNGKHIHFDEINGA